MEGLLHNLSAVPTLQTLLLMLELLATHALMIGRGSAEHALIRLALGIDAHEAVLGVVLLGGLREELPFVVFHALQIGDLASAVAELGGALDAGDDFGARWHELLLD